MGRVRKKPSKGLEDILSDGEIGMVYRDGILVTLTGSYWEFYKEVSPGRFKASDAIATGFENGLYTARSPAKLHDKAEELLEQWIADLDDDDPEPRENPSRAAPNIVQAYFAITDGEANVTVGLDEIREYLLTFDREEIDEGLRELHRERKAVLFPEDNTRKLTRKRDRAALHMAGDPKHYIKIEPRRR